MICSKCKQDKPSEAFYQRKAVRRGRASWCKQCISTDEDLRSKASERAKRWRETHREQYNAWFRAYRKGGARRTYKPSTPPSKEEQKAKEELVKVREMTRDGK